MQYPSPSISVQLRSLVWKGWGSLHIHNECSIFISYRWRWNIFYVNHQVSSRHDFFFKYKDYFKLPVLCIIFIFKNIGTYIPVASIDIFFKKKDNVIVGGYCRCRQFDILKKFCTSAPLRLSQHYQWNCRIDGPKPLEGTNCLSQSSALFGDRHICFLLSCQNKIKAKSIWRLYKKDLGEPSLSMRTNSTDLGNAWFWDWPQAFWQGANRSFQHSCFGIFHFKCENLG